VTDVCPCGSQAPYANCCEPIITGNRAAATAEQLMRARYSAFVTANVDFILSSTAPAVRPNYKEKDIRNWAENSRWYGLEVVHIEAGGETDPEGKVEFIARYSENNVRHSHHELAVFKKIDQAWYFEDGFPVRNTTPVRNEAKIGRNDPCSCGSGLKYKKCCGK
jgi:SEC-C motif domain protein